MIFSHEKLKNERMAHMQQEELAEKTGISLSVIKNIESGRKKITPESIELIKICNVLDLNPENCFVRNTKIISLFTNKGGAGKTTIAANLSHVLAKEENARVLMIDTDQQMNLTKYYGLLNSTNPDNTNIYEAFVNQDSVKNHIINTDYENLDIVISHYNVGRIEVMLPTMAYRETKFSNILEEVKSDGYYDYVIIDMNPSFSMFNHIILCATDYVIIPLEATAFGLGGIENVIEFVETIQKESLMSSKHKISILGVIISKFQKSLKLSNAIASVADQLFDDKGYMFDTKIKFEAPVGKSQLEEKPIGVNYSKSEIYLQFKEFAKEVTKRVEEFK